MIENHPAIGLKGKIRHKGREVSATVTAVRCAAGFIFDRSTMKGEQRELYRGEVSTRRRGKSVLVEADDLERRTGEPLMSSTTKQRPTSLTIKIRVDSTNNEHVRVTLFAGEGTLANLGSLCMRVGEYQLFGAALSLGAERTSGHLIVEHDDKAFREHKVQEGVRDYKETINSKTQTHLIQEKKK